MRKEETANLRSRIAREIRTVLAAKTKEGSRGGQEEAPAPDQTTFREEQEALHLQIILRFIALRCRKHRRCAQVRCRRSGRCAEAARTLRAAARKAGPAAPKPPRWRAPLEESLPDGAPSA